MFRHVLALSAVATPNASSPPTEPLVVTQHHIVIAGKRLDYTATAGRLPILDNDTGEPRAWIFFVAYTAAGSNRPLTFAWNGGPGSNSGLIQLGGLGPRRYDTSDRLIDNPETWLDRTDLVFIDPVGTGYSRMTRADLATQFFSTRGDAESVAEFIRIYRVRMNRWDSPLYLAGESYGVVRAAHVAAAMVRRGYPPTGIVMIGLTAPLAMVPESVETALSIGNFAAAAWYHGGLADGDVGLARALAAANRFALDTLAPGLARPTMDAANRDRLTLALSRHIGVAVAPGDSALVPAMPVFARRLLAARQLRLGHYDSRLIGPMDRSDLPYDPTLDPSLQGPPPPNGVARYLRDELRYSSDLQYTGPFGGTYPPPIAFRADWMSTRWRFEPTDSTTTSADLPLRKALAGHAQLRIFVACGYFDLVCDPALNSWVRDQLPAELRDRVQTVGYPAGHAVYLDPIARRRLRADVYRFFAW